MKNLHLLVVDDEEYMREAIAYDMRRHGFDVLTAKNGIEAFEIVKSNTIHLVISDVRMPGGDGIALLEKIRAQYTTTPHVILVTGFSDLTVEQFIAKGAKMVVSKPFKRKVLLNSVLEVLGIAQTPSSSK